MALKTVWMARSARCFRLPSWIGHSRVGTSSPSLKYSTYVGHPSTGRWYESRHISSGRRPSGGATGSRGRRRAVRRMNSDQMGSATRAPDAACADALRLIEPHPHARRPPTTRSRRTTHRDSRWSYRSCRRPRRGHRTGAPPRRSRGPRRPGASSPSGRRPARKESGRVRYGPGARARPTHSRPTRAHAAARGSQASGTPHTPP